MVTAAGNVGGADQCPAQNTSAATAGDRQPGLVRRLRPGRRIGQRRRCRLGVQPQRPVGRRRRTRRGGGVAGSGRRRIGRRYAGAGRAGTDLGHQLCGTGRERACRTGALAFPADVGTPGHETHREHRAQAARRAGTRRSATGSSTCLPRSASRPPPLQRSDPAVRGAAGPFGAGAGPAGGCRGGRGGGVPRRVWWASSRSRDYGASGPSPTTSRATSAASRASSGPRGSAAIRDQGATAGEPVSPRAARGRRIVNGEADTGVGDQVPAGRPAVTAEAGHGDVRRCGRRVLRTRSTTGPSPSARASSTGAGACAGSGSGADGGPPGRPRRAEAAVDADECRHLTREARHGQCVDQRGFRDQIRCDRDDLGGALRFGEPDQVRGQSPDPLQPVEQHDVVLLGIDTGHPQHTSHREAADQRSAPPRRRCAAR